MLGDKISPVLLVSLFSITTLSLASLKLPSFFSDHMVLQREEKIRVWGLASPGEKISVELGGNKAETKANAQGHWQVELPKMKAGGPYELKVKGEKEKIVLKDVYIGDVWIASGQSNMWWPVSESLNAEQEIASANYPLIRLLQVPAKWSRKPEWDIECKWEVCSPETVKGFSAVAYFFARELYKQLNIPLGIIHSSVGGTPAEAWTSEMTLRSNPELKHLLELWSKYDEQLKKWNEEKEKAKKEGKPEPQPPTAPFGIGWDWAEFWRPANLFNAMIAPFTRFPLKGAIWYQGESNVGRAKEYSILFPAMIVDWRKHWGIGDFPFLFVQLANFMQVHPEPTESGWAELREAQTAALKLPNTGMAVAIDIGDANDIHPKNKQDVGKRLALNALAVAYGKKVEYSGPVFQKMVIEGNKIRLYFTHTDGGLVCKGEKLKGFAIAGEDKKFRWAEGKIEGDTVVVWNNEIAHPVAVRYAWADNPECNLYNKAGLPAVPFRTDIPDYMK
ncbi:sialate O-acetylesterase [bacterium]|nr:sialate O-acetylesterase [bacterium]